MQSDHAGAVQTHILHICSALHFKTSKKVRKSNALWTWGEAICDTARRRGELEVSGKHLGDIEVTIFTIENAYRKSGAHAVQDKAPQQHRKNPYS